MNTQEPTIPHRTARLRTAPQRTRLTPAQSQQQIYNTLLATACSVPGQLQAARSLCADLSAQLQARGPRGGRVVRSLIHGESAWGQRELLAALVQALVVDLGYDLLDVDCSAYQVDGQASALCGGDAIYVGSRPGLVSGHLHRQPRSVVVFHRCDETLPSVLAALREPLQTGFMTDQHGLDPRREGERTQQPTLVDCRQAIFLFVASQGAHGLAHPDAEHMLGATSEHQRAALFAELRRAQRPYRGELQPCFDPTVLDELQGHHHVLQPLDWATLHEAARRGLVRAVRDAAPLMGTWEWATSEDRDDVAALLLCMHGPDMGMPHAQPQALEQALFGQLRQFRLDRDTLPLDSRHQAHVGLIDTARAQWLALKAWLGDNPQRTLARHRQELHLTWQEDAQGWWITQIARRDRRTLSDYAGTTALLSAVPHCTLDDVAGHDDARADLRRTVRLLQGGQRLAQLGALPPRGVLLYGPPGSGKTLLARALAGEAGMPFIATTGTQLLHLGTLERVIDLATRNAPCVVLIDEADALGQRGTSPVHDAVLTRLLAHIDGFHQSSQCVFHVLTTNRPDALDSALLRPGRVDRRWEIGPLGSAARRDFLHRHVAPLLAPADAPSTVETLVHRSAGYTGAQLHGLHQQLAQRLVVEDTALASPQWALEALHHTAGRSGAPRDEAETRRIAIHEAAHALLHLALRPQDRLLHVSLTGGDTPGHVATRRASSTETRSSLQAYLAVLLGGRVGEELILGADEGASTGAAADLEHATRLAWHAITEAGLDDEFGCIHLGALAQSGQHLPYHLHELATSRLQVWLAQARRAALRHLRQQRPTLERLAAALLQHHTLDAPAVQALIATTGVTP